MIKRFLIVVAAIPSSVDDLRGDRFAVRMSVEREESATAHTGGKVARDSERQLKTKRLLRRRALATEHGCANFGAGDVKTVVGADVGAAIVVGVSELVAEDAGDVGVGKIVELILAESDALRFVKVAGDVARRALNKRTRHGATTIGQSLH